MHYFEVFGLPEILGIDLKDLEKKFYDLSRKYHPDYYMMASEAERQHALRMTALLNDAYRTLKDPIRRVEYLLEIEGFKIDRSKAPQELLMEVFEINEQLEELKSIRRSGGNIGRLLEDLRSFRTHIQKKRQSFESQLAEASRQWDLLVSTGAPVAQRKQHLSEIANILSQSSYIRNLERDIEEEVSGNVTNCGN